MDVALKPYQRNELETVDALPQDMYLVINRIFGGIWISRRLCSFLSDWSKNDVVIGVKKKLDRGTITRGSKTFGLDGLLSSEIDLSLGKMRSSMNDFELDTLPIVIQTRNLMSLVKDETDQMKGKKIAITGGAGFIGSNLAWSLYDENEVVVIDNLSTGRIENIAPIIDSRKIQFIKGSVTDLQLMKRVLTGVDIVYHEAAIPSVPRSIADPISTNEAGLTGTLTTLLAARDGGVKRFINASSSSVYGDTPTLPKREEMPTNPISPYAATKVAAETYCRLFDELYGLSAVSLRYFNVFGPLQDPTSQYAAVIPRFISKAMSGEDLIVYGDGLQTRDFTYVQDAVRANILAAEGSSSGSYNIASGKQITIRDLASTILGIAESKANVKYEARRSGDIQHSVADITKAKKAFGYAPSYSIQQGLKETVVWFSKGDR